MLAQGVSAEAFDVEKRKEIYNQWQQYMVDEVPVFPTLYRAEVVPVNKRVMNYAIGDGTGLYLNDIQVNADKAVAAE
ncbi:TPA: hypothetical protein VJS51_001712 [Streptococcus pyogenes]|nr:hypothetical protein [Streptococcus pyogenes]